jgi:hypothetical protein
MFGSDSSGGMFGRSRHHGSTTVAGDCCGCETTAAPCAPPCGPGGCGVVANLPPHMDGPMLTAPPPVMTAPFPASNSPGLQTAPPPRFAPVPQAAPMPYTP